MKLLIALIIVCSMLTMGMSNEETMTYDASSNEECLYINTDPNYFSFPTYKCERCGYTDSNCLAIECEGETSVFCTKCLKKWCDKNMPKMVEVIREDK